MNLHPSNHFIPLVTPSLPLTYFIIDVEPLAVNTLSISGDSAFCSEVNGIITCLPFGNVLSTKTLRKLKLYFLPYSPRNFFPTRYFLFAST